jgi:hypothetical protein
LCGWYLAENVEPTNRVDRREKSEMETVTGHVRNNTSIRGTKCSYQYMNDQRGQIVRLWHVLRDTCKRMATFRSASATLMGEAQPAVTTQ